MKNYKLDTSKEWFWKFDTHLPLHCKKNLKSCFDWANSQGLNHLILGGDIFDFIGVSSFPRSDRQPLFSEVKKGMKEFNKYTSGFKKVVYIMGNHEFRARRYLMKNAPELSEFLGSTCAATEFILNKCGLEHDNIDFVECLSDKGEFLPVKFGKLNIFHGHEVRIGGYLNPCRKMFNIIYDHALFGHFHTPEDILRRKAGGEVFRIVCAGTTQKYSFMSHNHWACSCGSIESVGKNGNFKINSVNIVKGEQF
jgi:predicted phosphodiesterase